MWRLILVMVATAAVFVGAAFWLSRPAPLMDRVRYGHAWDWTHPEIETPNYEPSEDEREPVRYKI